MNDFRSFEQLHVSELSVIRHGFFRPWFELSDGQFSYGKLSSISVWSDTVVIETAKESWRVEREGKIFIKALSIINSKGENIGYIRRVDQVLHLTDGFEALFNRAKSSSLSPAYCLYNKQLEVLVKIKQSATSYKKPFKITFEGLGFKQTKYMPFLTLMLAHLAFLAVTRKF